MPSNNFQILVDEAIKKGGNKLRELITYCQTNEIATEDVVFTLGSLEKAFSLPDGVQKKNAFILRGFLYQKGIGTKKSDIGLAKFFYRQASELDLGITDSTHSLIAELIALHRSATIAPLVSAAPAPVSVGSGVIAAEDTPAAAPASVLASASAPTPATPPTELVVTDGSLVSTPLADGTGALPEKGFGYAEKKGKRPTQEDALIWQELTDNELTPRLVAQRLWTAYQELGEEIRASYATLLEAAGAGSDPGEKPPAVGSTAITTIVKDNHLITGCLGDAMAFVVIYTADGKVSSVKRLNQRIHKPSDVDEAKRVEIAGGKVVLIQGVERLEAPDQHSIGMSRMMGDCNVLGSCYDAHIDIFKLPDDAAHIQVITTCDGFTEKASSQTIEAHEAYLRNLLKKINQGCAGRLKEEVLAEYLAASALGDGSTDNVSVAVQTIRAEGAAMVTNCALGVYDGHGGTAVAHQVASHIGAILRTQLALTQEEYAIRADSVANKIAAYVRDNWAIECEKLLMEPVDESSANITKLIALLNSFINSPLCNDDYAKTIFLPNVAPMLLDRVKDPLALARMEREISFFREQRIARLLESGEWLDELERLLLNDSITLDERTTSLINLANACVKSVRFDGAVRTDFLNKLPGMLLDNLSDENALTRIIKEVELLDLHLLEYIARIKGPSLFLRMLKEKYQLPNVSIPPEWLALLSSYLAENYAQDDNLPATQAFLAEKLLTPQNLSTILDYQNSYPNKAKSIDVIVNMLQSKGIELFTGNHAQRIKKIQDLALASKKSPEIYKALCKIIEKDVQDALTKQDASLLSDYEALKGVGAGRQTTETAALSSFWQQRIIVAKAHCSMNYLEREITPMTKPRAKAAGNGPAFFTQPHFQKVKRAIETFNTVLKRLTNDFANEECPDAQRIATYRRDCAQAASVCKKTLANHRGHNTCYEFFARWTRYFLANINASCKAAYLEDQQVDAICKKLQDSMIDEEKIIRSKPAQS